MINHLGSGFKKKLATFAAALLLAGCASTSDMGDSSEMGDMKAMAKTAASGDIQAMIKDATASIKKAGDAGGEWRDSKKFLDKAKKAVKAGDMETAMKLVKKAKAEGEMGYAQAESQKDAGPWLF